MRRSAITLYELGDAPFRLSLLLGGGILALLAVMALDIPVLSLLHGLMIVSFVLAIKHPVWVLVPVVMAQMFVPGYVPGTTVSVRLAVALVATLIAAPTLLREIRLGDAQLRRVLVPALGFIFFVTLGNFLHSDTEYVFKYFRYQITQILALVLVAAVLRTREDLKLLAYLVLIMAAASGTAAIWQHYDRGSAIYAAASAEHIRGWNGRVMGLSNSPIHLANDMPTVLMPLLGVLACIPLRRDRTRTFLFVAAGMVFLACYFTYTRSAMLAVGAGIAGIGLCLKGTRRTVLVGAVLGAAIMYQLLQGTGLIGHRYYRDPSEDRSAASHLATWQVGLALVLAHPIDGIGHDAFTDTAREYVDVVREDPQGPGATRSIQKGTAEPHNDFLNVWFSWGIAAFLTYLGLFIGSLINLFRAVRSPDVLIRGLAVGSIGGLITYAVNSAFHNYLDSGAYLWMYAGLSVALAGLAHSTHGVVALWSAQLANMMSRSRRFRRAATLRPVARVGSLMQPMSTASRATSVR